MNATQDLVAEQLYREQQQSLNNRVLALKQLTQGIEAGDISRVPTARQIITRSFKLVSERLKAILDHTPTRTAGLQWLRLVGADNVSVLLLRKLISLTLRGELITIQKLGVDVGRAIIEEGAVLQAETVNNLYMQKAYLYMKKRGVRSELHARLTMKAAVRTVMHDTLEIDPTSSLQTSKWAINAAMEVGVVRMTRATKSKHSIAVYTLDPDIEELLFSTKYVDHLSGIGLLMVAEPATWEPSMIGGYLAPTKNPLARKMKRDDHLLCRQGLEKSAAYLGALNAMQAVPFCMDSRAVAIVRKIWIGQGNRMLSIPSINPSKSPTFPFNEDWDAKTATETELLEFANWKHAKSEWYTDEKKRKGEASRVGLLLKEATELAGRKVYAPVFGDWRGRMYYQGTPNPQGPDYARACIRFHDKKPLGDRGLFWLKVHISNSMGNDKLRFTERAKWVDDNMDSLVDGMLCPYDSDLYREVADYPIVSAVAVQELVAAMESSNPSEYLSGLPIHMDATCSGLQHYSAMLRDPVGAKYVNLFDGGQPAKADIYAKVLENVKMLLAEKLHTPERVLASLWLDTKLDRKLSKKPVMTYVYKASLRGVSQHAREWLINQEWDVKGVTVFAMGDFMAKLLFEAIAKAVPAAAACMDWICQAVALSGSEKPFAWDTPIGTRVYQKYRQTVQKRVRLRTCNLEYAMVLQDLENLRLRKMMNAAAPNFIHSLDSAHAASVVNRMNNNNKQVVSIHDSIGTHPCDVDYLHKVIREEFYNMYNNCDPLQGIIDVNNLGDIKPPSKGNLDLSRVLNSEFFFC